ncbi:hypothetical protein CPB84DRAFT_1785051 [Gymnopilus junonius]|uniref:Uncharacterized protein n=1 Tax=Gymnopilus junonius TaxID=109634 RepID=A0A9P5NL92_GYMJU|nr:hypothetical protein CPB84DRAFT_1785051 [Gymnopilus junonius]
MKTIDDSHFLSRTKAHPRELQIDEEFSMRNYTLNASGIFIAERPSKHYTVAAPHQSQSKKEQKTNNIEADRGNSATY